MWSARGSIPLVFGVGALWLTLSGASALAIPNSPGGASAPSEAPGASGGTVAKHASAAAPSTLPPQLTALSLARTAKPGPPPRPTLTLSGGAGGSVDLEVVLQRRGSTRASVLAKPGWVSAGRAFTVTWARSARLAAGLYELLVSGRDDRGHALVRGPHTALTAQLDVVAEAPKPATPAPSSGGSGSGSGSGSSKVAPAAGVPSPAQSAAEDAVFPVAGPHNFGGPENAFGAPRSGYSHQGQDILTAEGTPDVAPYAGVIESTSYQEGGAGYYAVERTSVGFSFFFAHCQAGSLAVSGGQSVSAGQLICRAGETGDATTPHLDFEIWIDGWRTPTGYPINPLPYLEAWEADGASGAPA